MEHLLQSRYPRQKIENGKNHLRIGRSRCFTTAIDRSVNMLRERNKRFGTIKFVDISSADYSPEDNKGLDYQTVMGRIHAILADGTIVTDVEVFRRLYEQVGLGWVYAITKYEPVATIADGVYGVWAKYHLTGRPPLDEIMELRRKDQGDVCNDSNKCKM